MCHRRQDPLPRGCQDTISFKSHSNFRGEGTVLLSTPWNYETCCYYVTGQLKWNLSHPKRCWGKWDLQLTPEPYHICCSWDRLLRKLSSLSWKTKQILLWREWNSNEDIILSTGFIFWAVLDLQKKIEYIVQKVLIHYPPPLHTLLLFVTLYIRIVHLWQLRSQ